uniref:Uncharacterized protein n=1 Tax=Desertifilum tharense IPPAS B-1220 TaxID=1781255 RepID=A0ACD5GU70_9CYAN
MAPISLGDRIRQFSLKSLLVTEPSNTRLIWVWGILLVGILGLMGNLYKLQVQQGSVLQQKAREQQQFKARTYAPRRPIVDRNGQILAIDRPAYTLYAHPILFNERPEAIAQALSQPLNKPPAELLKQFRRRESGIQLAYDLSEEVARRIGGLHLDGLELTPISNACIPKTICWYRSRRLY